MEVSIEERLRREKAIFNCDIEFIKETIKKNAKLYEMIAGFSNECILRKIQHGVK